MDYQNKIKSPGMVKTDYQQSGSTNPGNRLSTGPSSLSPTGQGTIQKPKNLYNPSKRLSTGNKSLTPTGNANIIRSNYLQRSQPGAGMPPGRTLDSPSAFAAQRQAQIAGIVQQAGQKIMENQGVQAGNPAPTLGVRANPVKSLEQFRQETLAKKNPAVPGTGTNGNMVMNFNSNADREYMNPLYDRPEYFQGRQEEYGKLAESWNSMDRKEMAETWKGDQKAFVSYHQGKAEAGEIIKQQMKDGSLDYSAESKQMQQMIGKNPEAAKQYAQNIKSHMAAMDSLGMQ